MNDSSEDSPNRIVHLSLDDPALIARNPDVEHERRVAIFDLLEENSFSPKDCAPGPYRVTLSLTEKGLNFRLCDLEDNLLKDIELSLMSFRRLVKDYFLICENYYQAIRSASPDKIETIDMGRRALHNEGSTLLQEKLSDVITMDFDTARRLFTLICVLQMRG